MGLDDTGGRKFVLTILVIVLFAGLTFADKMAIDSFKDFCLWAMGLYFTGNVGAKGVYAVETLFEARKVEAEAKVMERSEEKVEPGK